MFGSKVGVAAGCLLILAGGSAKAQGVVPGGWDRGFGSQPFASGWPGSPATSGQGFGVRPYGPGAAVAGPGPGPWAATPTTGDALGGLTWTIERTAFRRRGR